MRHILDTERWARGAAGTGDGSAGEEEAVPAGAPHSGEADDEPALPFGISPPFSSFRFNARRRL